MIKIQGNSRTERRQATIWLLPPENHLARRLPAPRLLRDREVITGMRYNSDIKNSLFRRGSRKRTRIWLFSFKRLFTRPWNGRAGGNLIWNKSRNTFFMADNSNLPSRSHTLALKGATLWRVVGGVGGCEWILPRRGMIRICFSSAAKKLFLLAAVSTLRPMIWIHHLSDLFFVLALPSSPWLNCKCKTKPFGSFG